MRADGDAPQPEQPQPRDAPGLEEALRGLGEEGRAGLKAATDVAKALRILIAADISLARSAFGRTLAFTGVAIAFGGLWVIMPDLLPAAAAMAASSQ